MSILSEACAGKRLSYVDCTSMLTRLTHTEDGDTVYIVTSQNGVLMQLVVQSDFTDMRRTSVYTVSRLFLVVCYFVILFRLW